jgi:hypothetical protein
MIFICSYTLTLAAGWADILGRRGEAGGGREAGRPGGRGGRRLSARPGPGHRLRGPRAWRAPAPAPGRLSFSVARSLTRWLALAPSGLRTRAARLRLLLLQRAPGGDRQQQPNPTPSTPRPPSIWALKKSPPSQFLLVAKVLLTSPKVVGQFRKEGPQQDEELELGSVSDPNVYLGPNGIYRPPAILPVSCD